MLPDITELEEHNVGFVYNDSLHREALHLRLARERPIYEFTLTPGDSLVFPPGNPPARDVRRTD